ncbi:MAG: hypothetical protein AAFP82_14415, partial [Bacteroidota bacterium]
RGRFESKKMITQKLLQRYVRQRINLDAVVTLLTFTTAVLELTEHWEANFRDEISAFIAHQTTIPDTAKATLIQSLKVEN